METQEKDPNEGQQDEGNDESTNIEHVEGDVNVEQPAQDEKGDE